MDKQNVVHTYKGVSLSLERKEILICTAMWKDLNDILPSKVSQT